MIGNIPFLLPVLKNNCNPLWLKDLITTLIVTHRVTFVNVFFGLALIQKILPNLRNRRFQSTRPRGARLFQQLKAIS